MQEENPLVSVLISSFNHEEFVADTIQSVLNQTFKNIELIIIDDGSSDLTPQIVEGFLPNPIIKFERQSNIGLTKTLNKMIRIATGKYICILASDDLFMLDKIEKQVSFLEDRPDIAICGGNAIIFDQSGSILEKQRAYAYRELNFRDIFEGKKRGIPAGSAMIRGDVLKKVGGYDPDIAIEDTYMWFKILHLGYKMAALNDFLFYYRQHSSNLHRKYLLMYDSMMAIYQQYKDQQGASKVIAHYRIGMAIAIGKQGDKKSARMIMKQVPATYFSLKFIRAIYYSIF